MCSFDKELEEIINIFNNVILVLKELFIYVSLYVGIVFGNKFMFIENVYIVL